MMEGWAIDPLIIPIVGILMPLVLVPTIIVLKHRHLRREWEHKERMKAMEIRLPTPIGQPAGKGTAIALIGGGVPIASVLSALLASVVIGEQGLPQDSIPLNGIAWGCAVMISFFALVTSLILASMSPKAAKEVDSADHVINGKPVFDPDAYDVVSSRA
ncbi:MAG: hypothetical protein ACHRXM_20565 [Isosphaerales bacterium]